MTNETITLQMDEYLQLIERAAKAEGILLGLGIELRKKKAGGNGLVLMFDDALEDLAGRCDEGAGSLEKAVA